MQKDEVDAVVAQLINALADGDSTEIGAFVEVLGEDGATVSSRLREVARGLDKIPHQI